MRTLKVVIEIILFLTGLALFAYILHQVGLQALLDTLKSFRGLTWLILLLYPLTASLDVLAWRLCFEKAQRKIFDFKSLFLTRLAGESLNGITPILDVGGEPIKVMLLSKRFHTTKSIIFTSCIIDRTALFIAQVFFVLMGLAWAVYNFELGIEWKYVLIGSAVVLFILCVTILLLQSKGLFGWIFKWLHFIHFDLELLNKLEMSLQKIDTSVGSFYKNHDREFKKAVLLHFLAWCGGGIEMTLLLKMAGVPISWVQGFMLEALLQYIRTVTNIIPANLGVQEVGLAFIMQLMGVPASIGVAVSLFKRLRQFLWMGLGFGSWAALSYQENTHDK